MTKQERENLVSILNLAEELFASEVVSGKFKDIKAAKQSFLENLGIVYKETTEDGLNLYSYTFEDGKEEIFETEAAITLVCAHFAILPVEDLLSRMNPGVH